MMISVHLKILVHKIREIVILMMSVIMVLLVEQIIVRILLAFILNLIAVMSQLLEMNIFVHLEYLVEKVKEIVMLMMSVKIVCFVDQTIVQIH